MAPREGRQHARGCFGGHGRARAMGGRACRGECLVRRRPRGREGCGFGGASGPGVRVAGPPGLFSGEPPATPQFPFAGVVPAPPVPPATPLAVWPPNLRGTSVFPMCTVAATFKRAEVSLSIFVDRLANSTT